MKFTKTIIIFVSIAFIISVLSLFFQPQPTFAMTFNPQIPIPGFSDKGPVEIKGDTIGLMIKAIYNYAIGIIGILAVVVMMIGGVIWITAGGSAERIGTAKSYIGAALTGLLLTLCSFVILKTVNPNLVEFKSIDPQQTKPPSNSTEAVDPNWVGYKDKGTACCIKPEDCGAGFTCDLTVDTPGCYPSKGACVVINGLGFNEPCDPNQSNQCKPPLQCIRPTGTNIGRCLRDNYYGCGPNLIYICRSNCSWSNQSWTGEDCLGGLWCCKK